ncbi:MAG: PBP1A family penicillin-binding protein [Bryobacteraceae bacterium]
MIREEQPDNRYRYGLIAGLCVIFALAAYGYSRFTKQIDAKLVEAPFSQTLNIYAAPRTVFAGEAVTLEEIVVSLRQSSYAETPGSPAGSFHVVGNVLRISPGPASVDGQEAASLTFSGGKLQSIVSASGESRPAYRLEPVLITNISDAKRERRRLVRFDEIPKVLVDAVLSAEDKRFFRHGGVDIARLIKAAYVDLREGHKQQGGSTLTMQLARSLLLDPAKNWRRKINEVGIALRLEHKYSKQEIFEHYCNEVYLGRNRTFNIRGFGEAAEVYFGKNIRQLTLPEAATLAGMIQRPGYLNPYRNADRLRERRNLVLGRMRKNGYLSTEQFQAATQTSVEVSTSAPSTGSQYFVDLMLDESVNKVPARDAAQEHSIYTSIDMGLQHDAAEAIAIGMRQVDEVLRKRAKAKRQPVDVAPQVALVALDPHTGEVKALIGGRDYQASQLNRALARRQPGSAFKPFVYASALNTGLQGGPQVFTPASTVMDEPTSFRSAGDRYMPANFGHGFSGMVTLRRALIKSLNVPTVKLAERVGYGRIATMAKQAGLGDGVNPTPSIALGAYETSPLDLAGAYTVFANGGEYVAPGLVQLVRGRNNEVVYRRDPPRTRVLDPRVAYLMVNLMEDVMRSGTAAGARSKGFTAFAAGKTGTSRDGWFAGFTSGLLCVVWVGFDDNRDLQLEASKSALPVWTEFMKRAMKRQEYQEAKPFAPPRGISSALIDGDTGMLPGAFCPNVRTEFFLAGTEPTDYCTDHNGFADRAAPSAN